MNIFFKCLIGWTERNRPLRRLRRR